MSINLISEFDDGLLNITILETDLEVVPLVLHFDGISDTVDVFSRLLTFGGNVVRDRLVSMSHYSGALKRINNLINTLLALIPD